jgi:hypothetical protein
MPTAANPSDKVAYERDDDFFEEERSYDELETPLVTEPFDPRKIDITPENQNVQYLVDLLEDDHIDLSTEFQRSSDLWTPPKMSRLIESLIIRLPIPSFYFAADQRLPPTPDNPLQVVDGLQRLSSLRRFAVDRDLPLTGLSFLKDIEGKRFDQLDKSSQRALLRAQVTVYIIRPGTPKKVTYILFERLNTGGLTLNPQEIRHALNQGVPAQYLKDLVEIPSFKSLVPLGDGRMKNRELALRYLAFRMTSYENYQRPLRRFLDNAMESLTNTSDQQRTAWKQDFDEVLRLVPKLLGEAAFSRQIHRPQFNTALFEAWCCRLAEIDERQRKNLLKHAESLKDAYRKVLNNDTSRLSIAVSSGTASEEAVKARFEEIRKFIFDVLEKV